MYLSAAQKSGSEQLVLGEFLSAMELIAAGGSPEPAVQSSSPRQPSSAIEQLMRQHRSANVNGAVVTKNPQQQKSQGANSSKAKANLKANASATKKKPKEKGPKTYAKLHGKPSDSPTASPTNPEQSDNWEEQLQGWAARMKQPRRADANEESMSSGYKEPGNRLPFTIPADSESESQSDSEAEATYSASPPTPPTPPLRRSGWEVSGSPVMLEASFNGRAPFVCQSSMAVGDDSFLVADHEQQPQTQAPQSFTQSFGNRSRTVESPVQPLVRATQSLASRNRTAEQPSYARREVVSMGPFETFLAGSEREVVSLVQNLLKQPSLDHAKRVAQAWETLYSPQKTLHPRHM